MGNYRPPQIAENLDLGAQGFGAQVPEAHAALQQRLYGV